MQDFFQSFTTREIAIAIWGTIAIVFFCVKSSPKQLIISAFQKKLVFIYLIIIVYLTLIIYVLNKLNVWETTLYKDFLIWFFTVGIISVFNVNKLKTHNDFIKIIFKLFSISMILEFLISYYSFPLIIELIIVPLFTILTVLLVFATHYKERDGYSKVAQFLNYVLSISGFIVFFYVIYNLAQSYESLLTISNVKSIFLFPFFTLAFLPVLYFIVVYMKYEDVFINLRRYKFIDEKRKKKIKTAIIIYGNLNLSRLDKAKKVIIFNKRELQNETNIYKYIKSEITND